MPDDNAERVRAETDQLFRRYSERLARLARMHLDGRLAGRLDAEDVVQSVFRTFFRRAADGGISIDSSTEIWQLLVTMTVNKARARGREHTAGVRDVRVERPPREPLSEAVSREPGPAEAAALLDEIDRVLDGLPDVHARVLSLRLEGHTADEIAAELGLSRRTVYRVLELLQRRLRESREA